MASSETSPPPHLSEKTPAGETHMASPAPATTCPVEGCEGTWTRVNLLRRHWMAVHMAFVTLFLCPIQDCGFKSPREDKVKDHAARMHQSAFQSPLDRKARLAKLPQVTVANRNFVDPGLASPPQILGKVLMPSPATAQAQLIPEIFTTRVNLLKRHSTDQQIQTPPKIPAYHPTPIVADQDQPFNKESICQEIFAHDKKILQLQQRNRELKRTLKAKELEHTKEQIKTIQEQQDTIQCQRNSLKDLARQVRELKARMSES